MEMYRKWVLLVYFVRRHIVVYFEETRFLLLPHYFPLLYRSTYRKWMCLALADVFFLQCFIQVKVAHTKLVFWSSQSANCVLILIFCLSLFLDLKEPFMCVSLSSVHANRLITFWKRRCISLFICIYACVRVCVCCAAFKIARRDFGSSRITVRCTSDGDVVLLVDQLFFW